MLPSVALRFTTAQPCGYGRSTAEFFGSGYYRSAVVSPNNVIFNANGDPASITSSTPFANVSAYLTGAWRNNLVVTITGLLNGATQYTQTVTLSNSATQVYFGSQTVDQLKFASSGGTDAGFNYAGTQFALDNLTYTAVPEPFTILGSAVALGAGAAMKRKQAKKALKA